MRKILNFGILGHPFNIAIIVLIILLWYFGAFTIHRKTLAAMVPTATPDDAVGDQ